MATANTSKIQRVVRSKQDSYKGEFTWIDGDLVQFQREDQNRSCYSEVDTNPDHWSFFLCEDLPLGQVQVMTKEGPLALGGNVAIWFPAFSIIEWHIKPGAFRWQGFMSLSKQPPDLPTQAIQFSWTGSTLPQSKREIYELIRSATDQRTIEREGVASPLSQKILSQKVKKAIQSRFREEFLISDLAEELGVSHEYVVRVFKKHYGTTPVYLRSRLRVFASLFSLLQGQDITDVAINSGFGDVCRFSKQFTKMMKAPPLYYQNKGY